MSCCPLGEAAGQADADEDPGAGRVAVPVVELRDVAVADGLAEGPEAAGPLRDLHGQQRLPVLADAGPLGDVAQPVEVHVGPAVDRHQRGVAPPGGLHMALDARHRQGARRLHDGAGVLEHVADGGADLVVGDDDDLVHYLPADPEGLVAGLAHGNAIHEDPDPVQPDRMPGGERRVHGGRLLRLHADDPDLRVQRLHVEADAADEAAATDRDEDGVDAARRARCWRRISMPIVPWPAMTAGSSKGWMKVRPWAATSSWARP